MLIRMTKARILCINNDTDLLNATKEFLADEKPVFEIETATSTFEAFQKLSIEDYDAIIACCDMDYMDSLEFLERLRKDDSVIPFILVMGQNTQEIVVKALNHGANYCFRKVGDLKIQCRKLAHLIRQLVHHKQTAEALCEIEAKYREVVERINEGVLVEDTEGIITFINPRISQILGYCENDLLGKPAIDFVPEAEKEGIRKENARRPHGIRSTYKINVLTKDYRIVPMLVGAAPLFSHSKKFQGTIAVLTDLRNAYD